MEGINATFGGDIFFRYFNGLFIFREDWPQRLPPIPQAGPEVFPPNKHQTNCGSRHSSDLFSDVAVP